MRVKIDYDLCMETGTATRFARRSFSTMRTNSCPGFSWMWSRSISRLWSRKPPGSARPERLLFSDDLRPLSWTPC